MKSVSSLPLNSSNDSTIPEDHHIASGHIAACVIALLILVTVAVLDCTILVMLIIEKSIPVSIRSILGSHITGCLFTVIGVSLGIILSFGLLDIPLDVPRPNAGCRIALFLYGWGIVLRIASLAAFAVLIFIVVKHSIKAVSPSIIVVGLIILWAFGILTNTDTVIPPIYGIKFVNNIVCILDSQYQKDLRNVIDALWIVFTGVIPLILSLVFPIVTAVYIRCKQVSNCNRHNSAMAKLCLFLVAGNFINFVGLIVPLLAAREEVGVYVSYVFAVVSLIPTPIFIVIFLKPVFQRIKRLILCQCVRKTKPSNTSNISATGI